MRKLYIDNIRWITVVLVVLYHVIYMFNGIETFGVIGPFSDVQYQDAFQYIVYPWFMLLLFVLWLLFNIVFLTELLKVNEELLLF